MREKGPDSSGVLYASWDRLAHGIEHAHLTLDSDRIVIELGPRPNGTLQFNTVMLLVACVGTIVVLWTSEAAWAQLPFRILGLTGVFAIPRLAAVLFRNAGCGERIWLEPDSIGFALTIGRTQFLSKAYRLERVRALRLARSQTLARVPLSPIGRSAYVDGGLQLELVGKKVRCGAFLTEDERRDLAELLHSVLVWYGAQIEFGNKGGHP